MLSLILVDASEPVSDENQRKTDNLPEVLSASAKNIAELINKTVLRDTSLIEEVESNLPSGLEMEIHPLVPPAEHDQSRVRRSKRDRRPT